MAYTAEFLKTASEELAKLPKDAQRQIIKRIEGLTDNPKPSGVKQLKGTEKFLRLRAGDYRIIYTIEEKRLVVVVISVGDRKEVYDNLKPLMGRFLRWKQHHK